MQRRRHDAYPASQGVGVLRARHRPVRADLQGRQGFGTGHGDLGAPLHHGRAAPREILPENLREDPEEERCFVLERLADPRLVPESRPQSAAIAVHDGTPATWRRGKIGRRAMAKKKAKKTASKAKKKIKRTAKAKAA